MPVAEIWRCVTKLGAILVRAACRSTVQLAPSGSFRNPLAWLDLSAMWRLPREAKWLTKLRRYGTPTSRGVEAT
jgi:hypothetical protein